MGFPSSPPPLDGVTHIDVRVDRTRWHVAAAGDPDAPVVLLLHGWPQHWWMWRRVIPDLARTHRVYAPDLRGFGWSDAPDGRYSKMGLAQDVIALLDALGVETCRLVGHDWGGMAAFLAAIRAPDRIERIAAFSITHPWLSDVPRDPRAFARITYQLPLATPFLGEWLQRYGGVALRRGLARAAGPGHRWDAEDLALYVDQWRRPAHARAASALYRTFLLREAPALLAGRYANRRLEMPVLLATGEHDPVVTPRYLAGYEGHAPRMRTAVIADAGHFVGDEQPERMVELIREELG